MPAKTKRVSRTRFQLASTSALRAIIPIAILLVGLYADGRIKAWRDLFSPATVSAVLAALGVKGGLSFFTMKDVEVLAKK